MAAPQLKTYFQTFTTDQSGSFSLTGILNVATFSKVNLEIIQFPDAAVMLVSGSAAASAKPDRFRLAPDKPLIHGLIFLV